MKDYKKTFLISKFKNEELKGLERLTYEMKVFIFGAFYIILKNDSSYYLFLIITKLIELLQLIHFSFLTSILDTWNNNSLANSVKKVVEKTIITSYFYEKSNSTIYLVVFYTIVFIIACFVINFLYLAFLFNKSIFSESWKVTTFKYFCKLIVRCLYIPFLLLYFSVFSCKSTTVNGTSTTTNTMIYSTDINCYSNFHFLHIIVGILAILVLLVSAVFISLLYYEYSPKSTNIHAKSNTNYDFTQVLAKLLLVIAFTFVDKKNNLLLVIIQFILSAIMFSYNYLYRPFYNTNVQIIYLLFDVLYLWTSFMVMFCKIINFSSFTGSLYVWFCGIPLLIVLMILEGKYQVYPKIGKLMTINKLYSNKDIISQVNFLLNILEMKEDVRESGILLRGFIRNHEENCYINDCPLKAIKKNLDNNYNDNNLYGSFLNQQIILYINRIYLLGISKFPNCSSLRISYSLFLYHYQKQKMKAKQELENAEKCSISVSQQFLIFRFKKLIIEDLDANNNLYQNETLDIENSIAYESHFRQCQQDILAISRLFLEFWTLLASHNSSPDIAKLNELSIKVHENIKSVQNHWKRMQYYKANDPKALKLYASLYMDLLNDKEKGKEILSLSKETADKKSQLKDDFEFLSLDDDFSNGNCIIICSAENDNYGAILKASSNASKIFGYLSEDLINGRPLDDLFIDCYNGAVISFLQSSSNNWTIEKAKKDYVFYAKTKQNRVQPVILKLLDPNMTIGDKLHNKIMIKTEEENFNDELKAALRKSCFIISSNLNIMYYSESAIELVSIIYGSKVSLNELSTITNLFPELYKNFDKADGYLNVNNFSSNKLSDTILFDLINDNNSNYNSLNVLIKTASNDTVIANLNNLTSIHNEVEDRNFLKVQLKVTRIDNDISDEHDTTKDNETTKKDFFDIKTPFKNNVSTDKNKDVFYCIKFKYDYSSKLSHFKYATSPNLQRRSINANNNETHFGDNKMSNYNNVTAKGFNKNFIADNIVKYPLSLQFDKLIKDLNNSKTPTCLMNLIKNKNEVFTVVYNWEGLDSNRFVKKDKSSDNINLSKSQQNKYGKDKGESNKDIIKSTDNDNNSEVQNNYINTDNEDKENNNNSNYDNEDNEENPLKDSGESLIEEEVYNLLRDEIENCYKRAEFQDRIKNLKDYGKNVRVYVIKNENDPREEYNESKIVEYVDLLTNSDVNLEESSSSFQYSTFSLKNNKDHTDLKSPVSLNRLQYGSIIILLVLIAYAIIELVLNLRSKSTFTSNVEMIFSSYQFVNEIVWSTFLMRNLIIISDDNKNDSPEFQDNIRLIKLSINSQDLIINSLTQDSLSLQPLHEELISSKVVPLFSLNSYPTITTQYRTLIEAMADTRVTLINIVENTNIYNINAQNSFVQNFMYNTLNDFLISLRTNALFYVDLVFHNCDYYRLVFYLYYFLLILMILIFTYILFVFLSRVDNDRNKILYAFYEIPSSYLNKLSESCLKFIEKNEKQDNEGGSENNSESFFESDIETKQMKFNKKKTSNKSKNQSQKIYLVNISIIFIIVLAFFSVNFGKNISMLNLTKELNQIYNTTLQFQSLMNFALNLEREKIVNKKTKIFNNDQIYLVNITINELYSINNNLFVQHLEKKKLFSNSYIDLFNSIMHEDLCSLANMFDNEVCSSKIDDIGRYGIQVIIMKYIENLLSLFEQQIKRIVVKESPRIALNSVRMTQTNLLYSYFIKPTSGKISENLQEEIKSYIKSEFDFRLIIFILFIVFTIITFFSFWVPFQNKLEGEIIRTKKMLEIIPQSIINEIDSLKE